MPIDPDEDDPPLLFPGPGVGPVRRRIYQENPKHGLWDRGQVSRRPVNGQDALDWSVRVKPTSAVRVGVDYGERVFVVLRRHMHRENLDWPWAEKFHGYVAAWSTLEQEQRNALIQAGVADHRGRIDPMTARALVYEELGPIEPKAAEAAFRDGDYREISYALLRLALNGPDYALAERRALEHIHHPNVWVRRNAATSLGHIARITGELDLRRVVPALLSLMANVETYGEGDDGLDDVEHFMGVNRGEYLNDPEILAFRYGHQDGVLEVELADEGVVQFTGVDPFYYRDLWTAPRDPSTPPALLQGLRDHPRRKLRRARLTRRSVLKAS